MPGKILKIEVISYRVATKDLAKLQKLLRTNSSADEIVNGTYPYLMFRKQSDGSYELKSISTAYNDDELEFIVSLAEKLDGSLHIVYVCEFGCIHDFRVENGQRCKRREIPLRECTQR